MTTPIDKDYVCVIDQGQKKPISPITHTKTVWDEEKQKYIDTIIKDLEYTVGLPVTTSLDITEEGKYALDAVAGHRLNEICEEVFQSADKARNYFARIVGISDPENYNLTTLTNKVRDYMNKLSEILNKRSIPCPSNPTFEDLISSIKNTHNLLKEYKYTFWLSYNDLAKSWRNNQNGTGIMSYYEPWNNNDQKNYIICLSREMLMKLSETSYIPPSNDIIMSRFDYPYWETSFSSNSGYPTEHSAFCSRIYENDYFVSDDFLIYYPCMSVHSQYNSKMDKYKNDVKLGIYKEDPNDNSKYTDMYVKTSEYSELNTFVSFGDYVDQLYVRTKSTYIMQYWNYFVYDNDLNTKNYSKTELARIKDIRGWDDDFNMEIGIPFTLSILAKE